MQESERNSAKRQGILPEVVVGIYVLVLGALWILDHFRPDIAASLLQVIRGRNDLEFHDHLRFRALLYYAASLCFVVLVPIILYRGFKARGPIPSKKPHLGHYLIALIAAPIGWYMYPLVAACKDCWMLNDTFYFWVTIFFFLALHIFAQAVLVGLLNLLRGK